MKELSILLLLFLVACSSDSGLVFDVSLNIEATCPTDREVIYKDIRVETDWKTHEQSIIFSWQCSKLGDSKDTYRIYKTIGVYDPNKESTK